MKRRLFNLLAVASLVFCVAAAAMWVRSHSTWESLYVRTGDHFWCLQSALGDLTFDHYSGWPDPPDFEYRRVELDVNPLINAARSSAPIFGTRLGGATRREWQSGAFSGSYGTICVVLRPDGSVDWDSPALPILRAMMSAKLSPPFPFWSVTMPYWSVVALSALPPIAYAVKKLYRIVRRRLRDRSGRCVACAYDLTGNVSGVCPECGTAVPASKATGAPA